MSTGLTNEDVLKIIKQAKEERDAASLAEQNRLKEESMTRQKIIADMLESRGVIDQVSGMVDKFIQDKLQEALEDPLSRFTIHDEIRPVMKKLLFWKKKSNYVEMNEIARLDVGYLLQEKVKQGYSDQYFSELYIEADGSLIMRARGSKVRFVDDDTNIIKESYVWHCEPCKIEPALEFDLYDRPSIFFKIVLLRGNPDRICRERIDGKKFYLSDYYFNFKSAMEEILEEALQ